MKGRLFKLALFLVLLIAVGMNSCKSNAARKVSATGMQFPKVMA